MSDDARKRHQIALAIILALILVLSFLLAESLEPPRLGEPATGLGTGRPTGAMADEPAQPALPGNAAVRQHGRARAIRVV
mgnify:CR=1 FL=1